MVALPAIHEEDCQVTQPAYVDRGKDGIRIDTMGSKC